MAECIKQKEKKETIVVSAGKNLEIDQKRPTMREIVRVKERKVDDAQYAVN